MHFCLLKMVMDSETITGESHKHATQVCEKLKSRFKVLAKAYPSQSHEHSLAIAVVMLSKNHVKLKQNCDEILNYVETTGLGRILSELIIIDRVDRLGSDDSSEESDLIEPED